ncbi:MAG: PAS-domain containing protein [Candidatus Jidaibacter sp.]|jgi:PAS domain-containing protein|nr:PAS-domain containing protein [Candidatus Jidaibacter sp.]
MKFMRLLKIVSPAMLALIILYFSIVELLIADKSQNLKILYFFAVVVTILIMVLAGAAVSAINIFHIFSNQNQMALDNSPAAYAVYALKSRSFKASKALMKILGCENEQVSLDGFLSYLTIEDQKEIGDVIKSSIHNANYVKSGIIKILPKGAKKEYFYRYIVKLLTGRFGEKNLCFWVIDYTDVVVDEMELVSLVKKYRVASFELSQIIDALPFPVWRQDLDGNIIFHNSQFLEFKKKYNLELNQAELSSKQSTFTKRLITKDRVETFAFSKKPLADQSGAVGVCANKTEVESTNFAIKALENILQKLIENISVGFVVLDKELRVVNFNLAFMNLFAIDAKILEQKPNYRYLIDVLKDHNHFTELSGFKEKHLQDIREVKDCIMDLLHIRNGITIKITIIPSKDGNTILTYENITPNLEIERELTKTKLMFNSVVNMIESPMLIVSQNGQINFINPLFVQTFFKADKLSNLPTTLAELMGEYLIIKESDVAVIKNILIECLESKNCKKHDFEVSGSAFTAQTMGLDDLSVILIIKSYITDSTTKKAQFLL